MKLSKNRINKLLKSKKQTRKKYNKKRKPAPKRKHKNTKNNKKIVNLRTKSLKRKPIRFYKSVESGGADGNGVQGELSGTTGTNDKVFSIAQQPQKAAEEEEDDIKFHWNGENKEDGIIVKKGENEIIKIKKDDILSYISKDGKTKRYIVILNIYNSDNNGIIIIKYGVYIKNKDGKWLWDGKDNLFSKNEMTPSEYSKYNNLKKENITLEEAAAAAEKEAEEEEEEAGNDDVYTPFDESNTDLTSEQLEKIKEKAAFAKNNAIFYVKIGDDYYDIEKDTDNKGITKAINLGRTPMYNKKYIDIRYFPQEMIEKIKDKVGSDEPVAEAAAAASEEAPVAPVAPEDEREKTTDDEEEQGKGNDMKVNEWVKGFMTYDEKVHINKTEKKNYIVLNNILSKFNTFLELIKDDSNFEEINSEKSEGLINTNETDDDKILKADKQKKLSQISSELNKIYGSFNSQLRNKSIFNPLKYDDYKDEQDLLKSIQTLTGINTLTTVFNRMTSSSDSTKAILNKGNKDKLMKKFFNKTNFEKFNTPFKRLLNKYKIKLDNTYEYADERTLHNNIRQMAGHLYELNEKYNNDIREIAESSKQELAEDEKKQQEFNNNSPAAEQTETGDNTQPAAPAPAPAQTSELTSTGSDEVDKLEPNLGKKYFIYKDGEGFRLSTEEPSNDIKSAQLILNTGTVDGDIQYLGIIPDKGFISPDGKEAAMTMATSVAGEENIFATSSLRIEFNKFVAEIKEALAKKDEDFGELKASIEEIIENQQQPAATPPATSAETDTSNAEPAAEPAAEN